MRHTGGQHASEPSGSVAYRGGRWRAHRLHGADRDGRADGRLPRYLSAPSCRPCHSARHRAGDRDRRASRLDSRVRSQPDHRPVAERPIGADLVHAACSREPIAAMLRLMGMRWAIAAFVAAGVAACTSSPSRTGASHPTLRPETSASSTVGTVAGTLLMVGGPSPGIRRGLAGTLSVHSDAESGPVVATVAVDASGDFRADVPPGLYVLTGHAPSLVGLVCRGERRVTVKAGHVTTAEVICPVP